MNTTTKRILIVEDDESIREGIIEIIENDGLIPVPVTSGIDAVKSFQTKPTDLILLDIMLPGMNGYDVCRKIREADKRVPILLLTSKSEEIDQVLGLELGADDYIIKPFRIRELLARIHSALRRSEFMKPATARKSELSIIEFGEAIIDRKRFIAKIAEVETDLSEKEIKLIDIFLAHPNEALSRDFLLNEAWSIDYAGTTRTLDQHIAKLRAKVEPNSPNGSIKTVHGVGYKYIP
ncbi:response regulator transcription factor [Puniceicoccaceae bacterium K14]|nr:response regulator transcription factor [Puniceicoccaceae bacterium K14]